jgi:ribonuclease Z
MVQFDCRCADQSNRMERIWQMSRNWSLRRIYLIISVIALLSCHPSFALLLPQLLSNPTMWRSVLSSHRKWQKSQQIVRRIQTTKSFSSLQDTVLTQNGMIGRSSVDIDLIPQATSTQRYALKESSQSGGGQNYKSKQNSVSVQAKFPTGPDRDMRFNESDKSDFEVTFLGTASCMPSLTRGVSSVAMHYNGDVWLFDCGESTQRQLQQSRVRPSKISKIFISHMHGDHSFGLPGVLCMVGQSGIERDRNDNEIEDEMVVDIYGPVGIRDFVRVVTQLSHSRITVPFRVHELMDVPAMSDSIMQSAVRTRSESSFGERPGGQNIYPDNNGVYHLFANKLLTVQAAAMDHTIPCVGFVVKEFDRLGSLRPELVAPLIERNREGLTALPENNGNHMKTFAILRALGTSEQFTFPDGTTVHGKDINSPTSVGRKLVIMGDTTSGRKIQDIAMNANLLIHEATNAFFRAGSFWSSRLSSYASVEMESIQHGHSTPQMAGSFAAKINAKQLVLTHFSPRFAGDSSDISMRAMWSIEDMARQRCNLRKPNEVVAAWDFLALTIPHESTHHNTDPTSNIVMDTNIGRN